MVVCVFQVLGRDAFCGEICHEHKQPFGHHHWGAQQRDAELGSPNYLFGAIDAMKHASRRHGTSPVSTHKKTKDATVGLIGWLCFYATVIIEQGKKLLSTDDGGKGITDTDYAKKRHRQAMPRLWGSLTTCSLTVTLMNGFPNPGMKLGLR